MTRDEFCDHMSGFIEALGDNYIAANLEDALDRYRAGQPRRPRNAFDPDEIAVSEGRQPEPR